MLECILVVELTQNHSIGYERISECCMADHYGHQSTEHFPEACMRREDVHQTGRLRKMFEKTEILYNIYDGYDTSQSITVKTSSSKCLGNVYMHRPAFLSQNCFLSLSLFLCSFDIPIVRIYV